MESSIVYFVVTATFLIWIYKRYQRMNILKRNGINGPSRNLIVGNAIGIFTKGMTHCFKEWNAKYGKICGFYIGGHPYVLISDIQLIKQIQIKDFKNFHQRPEGKVPKGAMVCTGARYGLALVNDGWFRQRKLLNGNFSPLKIKKLIPVISLVIEDTLMSDMRKLCESGKEGNISTSFQKLTFNTTVSNFFGISHENMFDFTSNDPLIRAFIDGTASLQLFDPISMSMILFPEFQDVLYPFRKILLETMAKFNLNVPGRVQNFATDVIQKRIDMNQKGEKINDFLQLMIDATEDGSKLSFKEMVGNSMTFMVAAFETTSTTLTCLSHFLVNYPDLQEKLRSEVSSVWGEFKVFDYDSVFKMPLMESAIYETLRIYPAVPDFVNRVALEDYHYENIKIHKGCNVMVDVKTLHKSEEYWKEPEKFDINRFLERSEDFEATAFQGFGGGNRNCIGMRVAIVIIKLVFCNLLKNYRLIQSENTEIGKLSIEERNFTETPKYGVRLRIERI